MGRLIQTERQVGVHNQPCIPMTALLWRAKLSKYGIGRGGTFQVWNLKKLKECSNFGILEGTYGMYFELTVSGRNL